MSPPTRWLVLSTVLLVAAGLGGCGGDEPAEPPAPAPGAAAGGGDTAGTDRPVIAVVPKGTTHEFWKSIHAGAVKAGQELGVEIRWQGPETEDDRKQQIDLVDNLITSGVDGIVLAPLDDKALLRPVQDAMGAQIPVVIIDSALQAEPGVDYVSFVATDNLEGGRKAGRHMADLLGGAGRVIMLRYQENSASTEKREAGFLEAVKAAGLQVVSSNQYAGATTNTAFNRSQALLVRFTANATLTVDGIYCPNESSTFGMLRALQRANLAGEVRFVGFDAAPKLVEALGNGQIDGLIVQDPFNMGYLGVRTLVRHLRGETVEPVIDTGSTLVTRDNMDQPGVRQLLNPPIDRYVR